MANQNLANISAFENLQNQTNHSINASSLSVFNTIDAVQNAFSTFVDAGEKRKKAMDDKNKIQNYQNAYKTLMQKLSTEDHRVKKQLEQNPNDAIAMKDKQTLDSIAKEISKH
jgi:superfamily I DNA and RNA helicase